MFDMKLQQYKVHNVESKRPRDSHTASTVCEAITKVNSLEGQRFPPSRCLTDLALKKR